MNYQSAARFAIESCLTISAGGLLDNHRFCTEHVAFFD